MSNKIWSDNRLPMTILKPFGWSNNRTLLQIASYWSMLGLSAVLHYRKYIYAKKSAELRAPLHAHGNTQDLEYVETSPRSSSSSGDKGKLSRPPPANELIDPETGTIATGEVTEDLDAIRWLSSHLSSERSAASETIENQHA
jgi:hypothetical protein